MTRKWLMLGVALLLLPVILWGFNRLLVYWMLRDLFR